MATIDIYSASDDGNIFLGGPGDGGSSWATIRNKTTGTFASSTKKPEPATFDFGAQYQKEFDAQIGQIQYEKAAGIGEFETPRPQVGSQLNAAAMDRVGFGREKSSIAPTIIDASTVQNVSNNTLIRPPSPSGQFLPGERRDFG